jgi:4-oxalmesaconate hydratase
VDAAALGATDKAKIFEGNARKVYPRINARLARAAGSAGQGPRAKG